MVLHAGLAEGRGAAAERRRHHGESLNCCVLAGGVPVWAMLFPCVGCECVATMPRQRGP